LFLRDLRSGGRGKRFGLTNHKSDKTYGQREGKAYPQQLRKGDIRSHGEIELSEDKKNLESPTKKDGGEMSERHHKIRFEKPQTSKELEINRPGNYQTDDSESEGQNSPLKMSEGNRNIFVSLNQGEGKRPRQGFGRPKSAWTDQQQSPREGRSLPYQEGLSESKESGKHGWNRKGRPRSHRETNEKQESWKRGQCKPNQDSYSESKDKGCAAHWENRKGFGKPTIKDNSDTVKSNAEKSDRKENARSRFRQLPKHIDRAERIVRGSDRSSKSGNSQSERSQSGGKWAEEGLEDRERGQGGRSAKRQIPKGDIKVNRHSTSQGKRYHIKLLPKVNQEDSRTRLSAETLHMKNNEIAKSDNGKGKYDKDAGTRRSSNGTGSDHERKPRTPPGFHVNKPPPGLGASLHPSPGLEAHVHPPPGFSDCS
jgi:hypothetical protein